MRLAGSLIVVCLALAACGPKDTNGDGIADGIQSPNSVTEVAPSTPVGTVSGQVLDSHFQPLSGADVLLNVGAVTGTDTTQKTQTDANGLYAFKGVPGGVQAMVTMSKGGYATARATTIVPATAGNFPINNGNANVDPFILTQLSGSMKFMVVTQDGQPANGAKATLECNPAALDVVSGVGGYGIPRGVTVVDAAADSSGMLEFKGIPAPDEMARIGGRYTLHVAAYDGNGDGIIDSTGYNNTWDGVAALTDTSTRTVVLQNPRAGFPGFGVVSTNVPSLTTSSLPSDNMLKPGEAVFIAFNEAILPASIDVKIADETGTQLLAQVPSVGPTGTTLTIQPSAAQEIGKKYWLSVRVTSKDSGSTFAGSGFFVGGDPGSPKAFALSSVTFKDNNNDNTLNTGETLFFTFNQPIEAYGFGAQLFVFVKQDLGTPVGGTTGTIGDFPGEAGYAGPAFPPSPFQLTPADPPPTKEPIVIDLSPTGFSSVWEVTIPLGPGATPYTFPNGAQWEIQFARNFGTGAGYETAWRQVITDNVTPTAMSVAP